VQGLIQLAGDGPGVVVDLPAGAGDLLPDRPRLGLDGLDQGRLYQSIAPLTCAGAGRPS
jgi:hypothetical protein